MQTDLNTALPCASGQPACKILLNERAPLPLTPRGMAGLKVLQVLKGLKAGTLGKQFTGIYLAENIENHREKRCPLSGTLTKVYV